MTARLRLVTNEVRPAQRSKLDALLLLVIFLASGSISAFVLGVVAHLGWELVR